MKWETPLAPSLPWYARLAHLALAAMMVLILRHAGDVDGDGSILLVRA